MAILGTDEDPNNPNAPSPGTAAAGGTGAAPAAGIGGTSGGGGFVGGGGGQGATTTAKGGGAPGGYTNLSSYLNANQGAGAQMAQGVENVVDNSGKAADRGATTYANSGVAAAQAGAGKVDPAQEAAIKAGTAQVDPKVLSQIAGGVHLGTFTDPGVPAAGYTGPGSVAGPTYSGPADAATMGGQAGTDRTAYKTLSDTLTGQLGNANAGQAGVAALLRGTAPTASSSGSAGIYQQPGYTAGENNLDAFLTGGSGAYQQGLAQMNKDWGGEGAAGKSADYTVNQAIGNAKQQTAGVQSTYDQDIKNAKSTSQGTADTYAQAVKDAQAKAAAWKPSFDTGSVTPPPGATLGETPMQTAQPKYVPTVAAQAAGAAHQAAKDTSPGGINHKLATFGGPILQSMTNPNTPGGGALGAGTPINGGGYTTLVNALQKAPAVATNIAKQVSPGGIAGEAKKSIFG